MDILDKEIVGLLKQGDDTAYKIVFNTWYSRLFYFAKEYVKSEVEAEGIVQNTFLTLWDKKASLLDDTNLNAYLYTITKNHCLKNLRSLQISNRFRDVQKEKQAEIDANYFALDNLETSDLTFLELEQILEKTIETLTPQCRKVFEMSRFEGLKNREIAEKLDISVKAVEANMTRALKVLKIALKDYLPLIAYLLS